MASIKVLPPHIANKIAAGEVVDRPASVVKELVENAIDAEADDITVVIEAAGKELIQVVDNGHGMSEADAVLAFERHATSKIVDVEDLDRIMTLGFRGEALPSIASVSRLEIKTCSAASETGFQMNLNGGSIENRKHLALNRGTTISVRNLFFNTPARRNFLRADSTEFNHILKWMKRFFLAHPDLRFRFIHGGEEVYDLRPSTMEERITKVFGERFFRQLVHVQQELGDIQLDGYVCRPDAARGRTDHQFIYLNRRSIVNRSLAHAVQQGYGNLVERGRFPQFVLNLEMPPHRVDINVHPTKMEVRFTNERAIYHLFLSAVRQAIQSEGFIPRFRTSASDERREEIRDHFKSAAVPGFTVISGASGHLKGDVDAEQKSQIAFDYEPLPGRSTKMHAEAAADDGQGWQPNLWQIHNRYILSQIKSGLVIIDQHVAHERILFEQILDSLNQEKSIASQQLLFPQNLELPLEDYLIYEEIREWLSRIGFKMNELSGRTIVIEAIPADVRVGNESRILFELIDYYRTHEGVTSEPHEKIAAAYACKNAVKSGEKLSFEAMNALVDQLFLTREPYFCPHGRPVIVTLGLEEFDRRFKRI